MGYLRGPTKKEFEELKSNIDYHLRGSRKDLESITANKNELIVNAEKIQHNYELLLERFCTRNPTSFRGGMNCEIQNRKVFM